MKIAGGLAKPDRFFPVIIISDVQSAMQFPSCFAEVTKKNSNAKVPHVTIALTRIHLHKIVAISVLYKTENKLSVLSLGNEDSSEKDILKLYFD